MGLITDQLNSIIEGNHKDFGYNIPQLMFRTDFQVLDYLNGQTTYAKNGELNFNIGIDAGKPIMIVGKPGSGKTTFAIQLIHSIMKKYNESTMYYLDYEQSATETRVKNITGMSDDYYKEHVIMKKVGIYTETLLRLVKQVAKFKKDHEKELLVPNLEGALNEDGTIRKIMPPTFILVDSIASMKTADYQEGEELNSLTVHGRQAIINKDVINRCLQPCMESNIILVMINHVTTNMSMGVTPPEAQTRFLKNTESISGGVALLYLANLLLKIEAKEKLEEKDKYGIKGFISNVTVVKSRNTDAGKSATFVFNQMEGVDNDLSNFEYLKANNMIKGAGVGMYLDGFDQYKFRMSNLKEKLATVPEFRSAFDTILEETLKASLKVSSKLSHDNNDLDEEIIADETPEDVVLVENDNTEVTE